MASLRRLILSPPLSTSATCFSGEPQQTPLKPLCCFFQKNPHRPNNLSLSLSRTRRYRHFETHFSSALESPPSAELDSEDSEEEPPKNRLYAQNVPWDCTPEDIRALFEKYGTVQDVELSMYDKTRNRGLAFVTMGSPQEALEALNNLQSYELNGRVIKIDYAKSRAKKTNPSPAPKPEVTFNLFVANLSFEARAKDLREFFKSQGHDVVSAEVIFHDNPRKSSGYGFASFKSKKEAETALSAVQGKLCMSRPIRVARSRQFVKQRVPESANSDKVSAVLDSSVNQAEAAGGN